MSGFLFLFLGGIGLGGLEIMAILSRIKVKRVTLKLFIKFFHAEQLSFNEKYWTLLKKKKKFSLSGVIYFTYYSPQYKLAQNRWTYTQGYVVFIFTGATYYA